MEDKEMMEIVDLIKSEINELYKIYEKDNNIFNKIITLFNSHMQNSTLISLEDSLGRDLEILLSGDYLRTIATYIEIIDNFDLKLDLDDTFLSELKYCSLLMSDSLLKASRAKTTPLGISGIKCLSVTEIDEINILIEIKRNDNSSMIFEADKDSLEGIKGFLENLINDISENTNTDDGE